MSLVSERLKYNLSVNTIYPNLLLRLINLRKYEA